MRFYYFTGITFVSFLFISACGTTVDTVNEPTILGVEKKPASFVEKTNQITEETSEEPEVSQEIIDAYVDELVKSFVLFEAQANLLFKQHENDEVELDKIAISIVIEMRQHNKVKGLPEEIADLLLYRLVQRNPENMLLIRIYHSYGEGPRC